MPAPVAIAIGTRPEAIKLAPVADALRRRSIDPLLLFTGQHPLAAADYGLQSHEACSLGCAGGGDPHCHADSVAAAVRPLLAGVDIVIVQGDTSSALGAARAAASARVPVAHVEAGLRSHDRRRPWPEEDFRIEIDRLAHLLFAPTELSAANLRRERVSGSIYVTGNSGIDAVLRLGQTRRAQPRRNPPKLLVTCHRRESWGRRLAGIAGALRAIADGRSASIDLILHPNPATASHMRALLLGCDGVRLHTPLGHRQAIEKIIDADCVLSDSGGMQEECAALGVPLLVLRDRTERPEAIACGAMTVVGTEPEAILRAVRNLSVSAGELAAPPAPMPYGDGFASIRIAALVADWLQRTSGGPHEVHPPPGMTVGGDSAARRRGRDVP